MISRVWRLFGYSSDADNAPLSVDAQINQFNQATKDLIQCDVMFAGMGIGGFMFMRNIVMPFVIFIPGIVLDAVFVIATVGYFNHLHNRSQMQAFQSQLNKLLERYRAMESSKDNPTTDVDFLKILEAVAPYVEYADIKLKKTIPSHLISQQYVEILAKPPMNIQPEFLIDVERAKHVQTVNNTSWFSLFQVGYPQTKRILYNKNKSVAEGWEKLPGVSQAIAIKNKFS